MKPISVWIALAVLIVSCEETLPPRIVPEHTLAITDFYATQGTVPGGRIVVTMRIIGENMYDETFQDRVNVRGQVSIWWNRKPEVSIHIPLSNANFDEKTRYRDGILTIDPGEKFTLQADWYLMDDDGNDILNMLDYSGSTVVGGIIKAKPEKFYLKAEFTLYERTGLLTTGVYELTLEGWKIVKEIPSNKFTPSGR